MTSQVGVVMDQLAVMLRANATLASLPISVGAPPGGVQAEAIWISGQIILNEDWASLDQALREETFELHVVVLVARSGTDYPAARDRLLVLVAAIASVARADDELGGTCMTAEVGRTELAHQPNADGQVVQADIAVRCTADLSA